MSEPLLLKRRLSYWPAIAIWAGFAVLMVALDGIWSLGNQALLLVLCSTLASFWLSASASVVVSAVAVTGFNWFAVPPRFTFLVALHQDLLLLVTLLCTSSVISVLMARLRSHAQAQVLAAEQARQQQTLASGLQQAGTVAEQVRLAQTLISGWAGRAVAVRLQRSGPDEAWFWPEGKAQALPELQPLLTACIQEQNAIGPGTGRYDSLPALVLPLRAGVRVIGALALAPWAADPDEVPLSLAMLQNLARLLADEIERLEARQQAQQAHEHLQSQQLRNTLLAAISHDYRTPLATITGAASALLQQAHDSRAQQQAQTILAEAGHLHRMTTHTLQLARLDGMGTPLQCSWESLEELWGVVLASARRRWPERAFQADVPPGLPLLWCEPILLVQLFENLVDNAVHYSPTDAPLQLQALQLQDAIEMAVLDRGPGIPAEWREKVFDPFSRMQSAEHPDPNQDAQARRGMGLGLALCQAVARAHEARLWIDAREGGGTAVRLRLPLHSQPLAQTEGLDP